MKEIISRVKYDSRILPYIGKPVIKVLVGQRRSGKSCLLQQIIRHIEKQSAGPVIFIDKEDEAFRHITDADSLIQHIKEHTPQKTENKTALFIDEIQEISGFENAIRSFAAKPQFDIYVTGSNSELLSGELSSRLTGRYIELPVYSLDFDEFCLFHQRKPEDDTLELFLKYGGMPFLKHLDLVDDQAFEYLRSVTTNIVYRDIIARYNIRNVNFLDRLLHFLAGNIGNLVKAKTIADYLKSQRIRISVNTVLDYLEYLKTSHLVMPVRRLDLRGKRTFEVGEKYYFQDIGLRNSLSGYRLADIGQIMENVVWHHLVSHGYEVFTGDRNGKEIDFVAIKENERVYIQVAYLLADESTIKREFGNLLSIRDNYRKIVVSLDPVSGRSYQGVEQLRLIDFLRDFSQGI